MLAAERLSIFWQCYSGFSSGGEGDGKAAEAGGSSWCSWVLKGHQKRPYRAGPP